MTEMQRGVCPLRSDGSHMYECLGPLCAWWHGGREQCVAQVVALSLAPMPGLLHRGFELAAGKQDILAESLLMLLECKKGGGTE